MTTKSKSVLCVVLAATLLFSVCGAASLTVFGADPTYYVCFENQNYMIRNANKMVLTDNGEYILTKVSLSSNVGFYVTDGAGIRYSAKSGRDMKVDSSDTVRYDIKFNPSAKYETEVDGFAKTDCYVTYALYNPGAETVRINGVDTALTYNAYRTDYDEYYISSVSLSAGDKVSCDEEVHDITADGYYRVLYTPGETRNGNMYLYNEDGRYGSGDDYIYHVVVSDAPRYFIVYPDKTPVGVPAETLKIDGMSAYLLTRYEQNVATEEYRTDKLFAGEVNYALRYAVYEEEANGVYTLLDDDNNADTDVEKLKFTDVGWYKISFVPLSQRYVISTVGQSVVYDDVDYYMAGNFNNWGFDSQGRVDLDDKYVFAKVEDSDKYYESDYDQYRIDITVSAKDLRNETPEFYITDGERKYRNLTQNVRLDREGHYIILFSSEHLYGNGRNYRYFFAEDEQATEEVTVSDVQSWNDFANSCAGSADYSANKAVYLTADIDFGGQSFVPVRNFNGKFNGGYHTLSGITIDEDSPVKAVFETVGQNASVERLTVKKFNVAAKDDDYVGFVGKNFGTVKAITVEGSVIGDRYVGGVVAYNGRVADHGVSVSGYRSATVDNCTNLAYVRGATNVGGVVGFNYGKIVGSVNRGEVAGKSKSSNQSSVAVGGIAGYSAARIEQSENKGKIYGDGNLLYAGGVAGICTGEIYFCFNRSTVSATRYAGGIVGYYGALSQNDNDLGSYFGGADFRKLLDYFKSDEVPDIDQAQGNVNIVSYAYNEGKISAKAYAAGIVAYGNANVPVNNCVSVGNVSVTAGGYAGGIAASMTLATVSGCLSTGEITASGMNANYVGGICGEGNEVRYSVSSASLRGNDYVGGIAGSLGGVCESNYANVVIVPSGSATNVGNVLGYCGSFRAAENDFNGKVRYNYYVTGQYVGGIAGTDYGQNFGFAAQGMTSDKFASVGVLSPYIDGKFAADRYFADDSEATYPIPYYLANVEISSSYDDDEQFEALFDKYGKQFADAANTYCGISYTYTFLEWNKDNGDLYGDGKLCTDNFDVIATIRVFKGQKVQAPKLIYAEDVDGRLVYKTDKGWYFASIGDAEYTAEANTHIYAAYDKATTTISANDGKLLVEGLFDERTQVEAVQTSFGYELRFTLNGGQIEVGKVKVKWAVDNIERSKLGVSEGGIVKEGEFEAQGNFMCFDYTDGQCFFVELLPEKEMPAWCWALIGAATVLVAYGIGFGIATAIHAGKRKHARSTATTAGDTTTKRDGKQK